MNIDPMIVFQGHKIEILEMFLSNVDNKLKLSWKVLFENTIYRITFYNISRLRMDNMSIPLDVQGFEIINHSFVGWAPDSNYEIRDFEDDRVHFFCEYFKIDE